MKFHWYIFFILIIASLLFIGGSVTKMASDNQPVAGEIVILIIGFIVLVASIAMLIFHAWQKKHPHY